MLHLRRVGVCSCSRREGPKIAIVCVDLLVMEGGGQERLDTDFLRQVPKTAYSSGQKGAATRNAHHSIASFEVNAQAQCPSQGLALKIWALLGRRQIETKRLSPASSWLVRIRPVPAAHGFGRISTFSCVVMIQCECSEIPVVCCDVERCLTVLRPC